MPFPLQAALVGTSRCLQIFLVLLFCSLWFVALFNNNPRVVYLMPEVFVSSALRSDDNDFLHSNSSHSSALNPNYCSLHWDDLQVRDINIFDAPPMAEVLAANRNFLNRGGKWAPGDCIPFQKVAIIIPYRNRYFHLRILLQRLHPMLRKQRINYRIFLVHQAGDTPFNRGMLMNVGINEALKMDHFDCFIFHDVDLIPEHDRNIYLCDSQVRHLSSAIDEMRYHVLFDNYAGGVVALTRENIFKINGYPNAYWGWGNEDDDFSARTMSAGLKLSRPPEYIGRYKMIRHKKASRYENGNEVFFTWRSRQFKDGLNSLSPSTYQIVKVHNLTLYTNVSVDLRLPAQEVLESRTKGPNEGLYWFLKFYGWLP